MIRREEQAACRCYLLIVGRFIGINTGLSSHRNALLHLSIYRLLPALKNIRRIKTTDVTRTRRSLRNACGIGGDTWSHWSPPQVTKHTVWEAGSASVFKEEVRESKHIVSGSLQRAGSNYLERCQCPKFQTRQLPSV